MKKIHFLLFFIAITLSGFSQKNKFHTSYIGITLQPSHYWLYNKDEFTAPDTLFGVKNDSVIINGLAYGLSYGHYLKKNFGINIGLQYSSQTQYYKFDYNPESPTGNWWCHTNLKYIKFPIFLTHRKELSNNKFITFSYGIQTSFLTYAIDNAKYSVKLIESNELGIYTYISKNDESIFKINNEIIPREDSIAYFADWKYKHLIFGTNISIGYEQYLNNKISFNIALNADYDLTNVDNTHAIFFRYEKDVNGNINRYYPYIGTRWRNFRHGYGQIQYDRKPSHNIHLGLEFGFKYWFGEKALHIERKIPKEW